MVEHIQDLSSYFKTLPESMPLKKKIVQSLMKSIKPLTQAEVRDLVGQADWSNVKRVLTELTEEGLLLKQRIGIQDYYVKVGEHTHNITFTDGRNPDVVYFIDEFMPDMENGQPYIRIKQSIRTGVDKFETLGKITLQKTALQGIINVLKQADEWDKKKHL
jgi:hypothetical protein